MSKKYTIEIPEFYLLIIAVHGNMGDGKLPDTMRAWAQRQCEELGIIDKFREMQDEKISTMRKRLRNVLGNEIMNTLDGEIDNAVNAIKSITD